MGDVEYIAEQLRGSLNANFLGAKTTPKMLDNVKDHVVSVLSGTLEGLEKEIYNTRIVVRTSDPNTVDIILDPKVTKRLMGQMTKIEARRVLMSFARLLWASGTLRSTFEDNFSLCLGLDTELERVAYSVAPEAYEHIAAWVWTFRADER